MNILGMKDKDINYSKEILSGIVIAIALVPEAIAFSFVLGVSPVIGLYSAIIIGFITSFFGGRAGMISGATGAVAAVFAPLVSDYGIKYLFVAVILMGIFQIIFGLLNIGKLFRLISKPIMLGFVNGLAIIILLSQVEQFKIPGTDQWLVGIDLFIMILLSVFTFFLIIYIPKYIKSIPSSLIAIVVVTIISLILGNFDLDIYNVSDMIKIETQEITNSQSDSFLTIFFIVIIPALSAAIVGLVESLLTLGLLDELTNTKGNSKKEAIAQGIANVACGLAGGMGGCAMIGQSMINYNNGARKYLSSFTAALFLLLFILFGKDIIGLIPLASLVGVMLIVVYKTFEWDSIKLHKESKKIDVITVIVVAGLTVITGNLAIGVVIGVLITIINFTWTKTTKLEIYKEIDYSKKNITIYLDGTIFFGTEDILKEELKDILNIINDNDIEEIIYDFARCSILDYSSAEVFRELNEKNNDKKITYINVNLNTQEHIDRITLK